MKNPCAWNSLKLHRWTTTAWCAQGRSWRQGNSWAQRRQPFCLQWALSFLYIHIVNLSRFTHDSLHWKSRLGGTLCSLTTKLSKERIVFYPNYVVSIFVQCASLCELDRQRTFVIFHLLMHFLFFLLLLSSVVWVLTDKWHWHTVALLQIFTWSRTSHILRGLWWWRWMEYNVHFPVL